MSASKPTRQSEPLRGQEYPIRVPPIHKLPVDENGKVTVPSTIEELEAVSKPDVLIPGGGIGGLTLALLLHKANIPFLVLERAKEIKPLASFLPLIEDNAPVKPLYQRSLRKTLPILQKLSENPSVVATESNVLVTI
ncbi:hypothetical protein BG006_008110 [Podila minutissima]|uniref:FAD-binding domain-containing protein n=1 Tax=Podila minutissima TaxID=64525 RepID=A0A9P5SGE0_9FUNG|nr:hypothetical protein BG006_008110 [Podila minutissima]